MFKATIIREMSAQEVADLMVGALEGGSNYWLSTIRLSPDGYVPPSAYEEDFFDDPANSANGLKDKEFWEKLDVAETIVFVTDEDEVGCKMIDKAKVEEAITRFYKYRPGYDYDNHDACDADCFLQMLLLDEVVYG